MREVQEEERVREEKVGGEEVVKGEGRVEEDVGERVV